MSSSIVDSSISEQDGMDYAAASILDTNGW